MGSTTLAMKIPAGFGTPPKMASVVATIALGVGANATIGEFKFIGSFTTARAMTITGLTAGTTYTFSVRAVSGSNRYSDWSDPVAHMCM